MNSFAGLPPGTILQLLQLERRLKLIEPGFFVEVGPGTGEITALLLSLGWRGAAYDLNPATTEKLKKRFASYLKEGALTVDCCDFIKETSPNHRADLFITCMVIEHIPKIHLGDFWCGVKSHLKPSAKVITFVPSSPRDWGIEDDIAGHVERYTFSSLDTEMQLFGLSPSYTAGLTFPVSNLLLPLSNHLVAKTESQKQHLSLKQRTALSGNRSVEYKTQFPFYMRLILNRWVMKPLDLLQRICSKFSRNLVIYQESQILDKVK